MPVTEFLRAKALIDSEFRPLYTISVVNDRILNVRARTSPTSFYHVRMKLAGTLPEEYGRHNDAYAEYPERVPQPLGRTVNDEWDISVFQGIEHRRVSPGDIGSGRASLIPQIVEFFDTSGRAAAVSNSAVSHQELLSALRDQTNDAVCRDILSHAIESRCVEQLPSIRQHGDLVTVNLGISDSGLVIFDWEDFGRITLPGLDLCTIIASDLQFDANELRILADSTGTPRSSYARLLSGSCPALGLSPHIFRELLPLYLVVFLCLKSEPGNYGDAIANAVRRVVHEVWH